MRDQAREIVAEIEALGATVGYYDDNAPYVTGPISVEMHNKFVAHRMEIVRFLEERTRTLRDAVFGPQSDNEWEQCKHNWMRPDSVAWLREKAKRVIVV